MQQENKAIKSPYTGKQCDHKSLNKMLKLKLYFSRKHFNKDIFKLQQCGLHPLHTINLYLTLLVHLKGVPNRKSNRC